MTALQKLLYDALRAFGCRYVRQDGDGDLHLTHDGQPLLLQPSGQLYDLHAGKWRCVTYNR